MGRLRRLLSRPRVHPSLRAPVGSQAGSAPPGASERRVWREARLSDGRPVWTRVADNGDLLVTILLADGRVSGPDEEVLLREILEAEARHARVGELPEGLA